MHRNVTVVVIILILVVVAGYLVWLRSKFQQSIGTAPVQEQMVPAIPTPSFMSSASPSATPLVKGATSSAKPKAATSSSTKK